MQHVKVVEYFLEGCAEVDAPVKLAITALCLVAGEDKTIGIEKLMGKMLMPLILMLMV